LKQLVADSFDKADPERYCGGKLLSPQRLPARAVEHACEQYEVSEQRACRVEWQWPPRRTDEDELTHRLIMDLGGIRHFRS